MDTRRLKVLRCPICGQTLGLVKGKYSLRCEICKKHPIITGNTETNEYTIKIRGIEYKYHAFTDCMGNWIILMPKAERLQPVNPCTSWHSNYMGEYDTYKEARDFLLEYGYKHEKIQFAVVSK